MSDDPAHRALQEIASLRGEVTILHEGLRRVADAQVRSAEAHDADRIREADERKASRRYTLGATFTASAIVLSAVGLFVNSLT